MGAIVSLVTGALEARAIGKIGTAAEEWAFKVYCLVMSLAISAFVNFFCTWGGVALGLWLGGKVAAAWLNLPQLADLPPLSIWISLGGGFAAALLMTGVVVYNLWVTDPLTRGIRISVLSRIAAVAVQTNVTITERK